VHITPKSGRNGQKPASRPPTIGELGWQVFFYFFLAFIFLGESLASIVPFPEGGP
jgi:hypothetical protein